MRFVLEADHVRSVDAVDEFGDSYARDTTVEELRQVCLAPYLPNSKLC
jgi:hypothetical protein